MINRLQRGCVVLAWFGIVVMACGDDEGSSSGTVTTAGSGGARSASVAGRGSSAAGSGARRGTASGQMCPMTEAEATGACMPSRGSCMFGERTCDCTDAMTWACWAPSDCPTSVPAEQSSCDVVGMACTPMRGTNCECTAQGWDCGQQYCPAAEPMLGSACDDGDGVCTYGARTCDCDNSLWVCWDPASDCSAEPPLDRAACPLDGVVCEYGGGSCECSGTGWRCRGVDNDPEDAGVPAGNNNGAAGSTAGRPATGGAGAAAAGTGVSGAGTAGTPAAAGASGAP